MTLGEIFVLLVLTAVVGLAIRSVWKSRRSGSHCGGDCSQCGGCRHK